MDENALNKTKILRSMSEKTFGQFAPAVLLCGVSLVTADRWRDEDEEFDAEVIALSTAFEKYKADFVNFAALSLLPKDSRLVKHFLEQRIAEQNASSDSSRYLQIELPEADNSSVIYDSRAVQNTNTIQDSHTIQKGGVNEEN
jgi:hypothetical protein